jgi:Family of unknown function (DUF5317)
MLVLLIPILAALAAAALRVGSLVGLQRLRIDWWPLAIGSIAVQLALFNPPIDRQAWALEWGPWIWVGCLIAMLAVLIRNGLSTQLGRGAFRLAALGIALNLFVVVVNGGYMPQSPEARLVARGTPLVDPGGPPQLRNVTPSNPDTRFAWLGDVIAQPAWLPTANVMSIGDLVLSMALGIWVYRLGGTRLAPQVRRQPADS